MIGRAAPGPQGIEVWPPDGRPGSAGRRRGSVPLLDARGKGPLDLLLGVAFGQPLDVRDLADDEVLGALVHLLLAEGEALLLADEAEVLEHLGDLGDPPRLHLLDVLLVAPLPVLVGVDVAVLEDAEERLDLPRLAQRPEADQVAKALVEPLAKVEVLVGDVTAEIRLEGKDEVMATLSRVCSAWPR